MPAALEAVIASWPDITPTKQHEAGHKKTVFDFFNVDFRMVLMVFAKHEGMNLIYSDELKGTVTARFVDVPPPKAMRLILRSKGYDLHGANNVYIVRREGWKMPPSFQREIATLENESVSSKPEATSFDNREVREALADLAKKAGTSLDLPENVWGNITARFTNLPPAKIIQLILESKVCSGDPVYDPEHGVEIVVE